MAQSSHLGSWGRGGGEQPAQPWTASAGFRLQGGRGSRRIPAHAPAGTRGRPESPQTAKTVVYDPAPARDRGCQALQACVAFCPCLGQNSPPAWLDLLRKLRYEAGDRKAPQERRGSCLTPRRGAGRIHNKGMCRVKREAPHASLGQGT